MALQIGDALRECNPTSLHHLWVICTLPDALGTVVILNMTTRRRGSDTTCVLIRGDHPSVDHPTVINYREGWVRPLERLEWQLKSRALQHEPAASYVLLDRIRKGALLSRHTPPEVKAAISTCTWPLNAAPPPPGGPTDGSVAA